MLFDLIQYEHSFPVEIGLLNIDPVLNSFFFFFLVLYPKNATSGPLSFPALHAL